MENLDDVLPYLKLRDGEEILFAKRFEGAIPITWLAKYHEPEKFPEHLITIKKEHYFFDQLDIITNFRLIKFGINYIYMEKDRVTPLSEIFHHENLFLWVNLEDIIDFNVHFELVKDGYGGMGFKFIGKGRLIVKENPLHFTGYNYEEYCQVRDIAVKLLKFDKQEIDKNEDMKIQEIIKNVDKMSVPMFLGVIIIGLFVFVLSTPIDAQNLSEFILFHPFVSLYAVYMLFFLLFNIITRWILHQKSKEKKFFTLMKFSFAWYIGPGYSLAFFGIGIGVLMVYGGLSSVMDNKLIALLISLGFWELVLVFAFGFDIYIHKKKKKSKKSH
ncbi:hypothetical protein DSAG12_01358 [Promethearchaeum syntrophicum]|uniref:Uncharacterized protein n=1 Tax=Promethearchaeum syntrophicum TaxID=2594042 RepID=A0A5B9D8W3_9ARCH|nr:hypothetical protein [Candidatus Prometheoarchaeum syntrophicum]QEE15532.1 hypothetical protein DSAG12_01358 [Candidatus Prometheoarchaeum syntrophicum]